MTALQQVQAIINNASINGKPEVYAAAMLLRDPVAKTEADHNAILGEYRHLKKLNGILYKRLGELGLFTESRNPIHAINALCSERDALQVKVADLERRNAALREALATLVNRARIRMSHELTCASVMTFGQCGCGRDELIAATDALLATEVKP